MVQLVGKIMPGGMAIVVGLFALYHGRGILDLTQIAIFGFMVFWGMSTAYYPGLEAITETKEYFKKRSNGRASPD